MCGRYTITTEADLLEKRFNAKFTEKNEYKERYNAAPSQNLPIILNNEPKAIKFTHWGIHYSWMDKMSRNELINIRKETLEEKHTFKKLLDKQRCLVLADGFYEWKKVGSKKQPYQFIIKKREPYAFAGLWDEVKDDKGNKKIAFAIITTIPNRLVAKIHNRMPVILDKTAESKWLNDGSIKLLDSFPANKMTAYPVSNLLNNARSDSKSFIIPSK